MVGNSLLPDSDPQDSRSELPKEPLKPRSRSCSDPASAPKKLQLLNSPRLYLCWPPGRIRSKATMHRPRALKNLTSLLLSLSHLNIAVPVRMLRRRGSVTAFEPARAGFKRFSEGVPDREGSRQVDHDYRPQNNIVNNFSHAFHFVVFTLLVSKLSCLT